MEILTCEKAKEIRPFFHPEDFPIFPTARFINIVLLRKSESEMILRTDEGITKELTQMGYRDCDVKARVVFTRRKAVAPERRTGREFLRSYGIIGDNCSINASMCGRCPDCIVYGFAAAEKGGQSQGSLKSRVFTEDAYSILPADLITDIRTLNALSEMETMMDVEKSDDEKMTLQMRQSLSPVEYIKPEVHFVDIETLRDIREVEFVYVLGNILRTTRYGATSSRMGKVSNKIVAIVAAETELFSTLQLTKMLWDSLKQGSSQMEHPLREDILMQELTNIIEKSLETVPSKYVLIKGEELSQLISEVAEIYRKPERTEQFVNALKQLKGIL